MAHVWKSIRDNIVTAATGLSTTGARVYRSRIYPLETASNLPGLSVYTLREASEADTMGGSAHGLAREVDIVVEAYVRALGLPRINSGAQSRSQNALRFAQCVLLEPTG